MAFGIIDERNHQEYTYMSNIITAIGDALKQYNWLITDCECYPQNKEIQQLLRQEYCWLSGDELLSMIEQEDFQWIWGILCGFEKSISPENALQYSLPFAENYFGYYQNPVSLQHPLSSIEIVPCDSSSMLMISNDKSIIDDYLKHYPKCENLTSFNSK